MNIILIHCHVQWKVIDESKSKVTCRYVREGIVPRWKLCFMKEEECYVEEENYNQKMVLWLHWISYCYETYYIVGNYIHQHTLKLSFNVAVWNLINFADQSINHNGFFTLNHIYQTFSKDISNTTWAHHFKT